MYSYLRSQTTIYETSLSTEIVSTLTQCFMPDAAITMICARKRSIDDDPIKGLEEVDRETIQPSASSSSRTAAAAVNPEENLNPVSYTHLTLPTIYSV